MTTYKTTANLNQRKGAGTLFPVIQTIPTDKKVSHYGYVFEDETNTLWYLVDYNGKMGFCSGKYLKEV